MSHVSDTLFPSSLLSNSPKHDDRFDTKLPLGQGLTPIQLSSLRQSEAELDQHHAEKLHAEHAVFAQLSPDLVQRATNVLLPYINADRLARVDDVLKNRTTHCRFLFENPINPSNVWACLRTIESFGIQHIHVVVESGKYSGVAAINQKRGMRTAMGSAKWLTLKNYASTMDAIAEIKKQKYLIYASDLNPNSKDVRDVDWNAGPICVCMGNEGHGISEELRQHADVTFTLPMVGFAESFNLSVATAITLAHMSAASGRGETGPIRPGYMEDHERNCLRLKWLLNSLPQKKMGRALLRREGIELPNMINSL